MPRVKQPAPPTKRRDLYDETALRAAITPEQMADVFYSRFGGWKIGRRDRDDDVRPGETTAAMIRNFAE